MTKILMMIGIALGALLIAGVVLALVAPKRISIRNTIFIQAAAPQVYDHLRFMGNFPNWSPFKAQDPEQKFSISGPDGALGATFHWEGVKEKSKGAQTVVALQPNHSVKIQCDITEPFQSKPTFTYNLAEQNGGVTLVQDFEVEMPVPANVFGLLFGLKSKIGATNLQGLNLLKQHLEKTSNVLQAQN
jgi:hypothetical protein